MIRAGAGWCCSAAAFGSPPALQSNEGAMHSPRRPQDALLIRHVNYIAPEQAFGLQ